MFVFVCYCFWGVREIERERKGKEKGKHLKRPPFFCWSVMSDLINWVNHQGGKEKKRKEKKRKEKKKKKKKKKKKEKRNQPPHIALGQSK